MLKSAKKVLFSCIFELIAVSLPPKSKTNQDVSQGGVNQTTPFEIQHKKRTPLLLERSSKIMVRIKI